MRFTAILLSGVLAALASAQTTQTTTSTATTLATVTSSGAAPAQTTAESDIVKCINACPLGDVSCTSKCIAVPDPDPAAVNATTECVAKCPQGNGTAQDNLNYANCRDACIGQYYFTTSGTPNPTGGSGSGSGTTGGAANPTGKGASGSGTGTASNTASGTGTASASASPTKNAGEAVRVAGSAVGLMGLLAAFVAL